VTAAKMNFQLSRPSQILFSAAVASQEKNSAAAATAAA